MAQGDKYIKPSNSFLTREQLFRSLIKQDSNGAPFFKSGGGASVQNPYILEGALAAYSVARQPYDGVTAAFDLRRSSDDGEEEIGYLPPDIDVPAMEDHVGVGDGFVSNIVDNGSRAKDVFNSTTAEQPKIVDAGSVILRNEKPAMYFPTAAFTLRANTANDWPFLSDGSTVYTIFWTGQIGIVDEPGAVAYCLFGTNSVGTSGVTGIYLYYNGSNNSLEFACTNSSGDISTAPVRNTSGAGAVTPNTMVTIRLVVDLTNATPSERCIIQVNGGDEIKNNINTGSVDAGVPFRGLQIGGWGNSASFVGYFSELLIYSGNVE